MTPEQLAAIRERVRRNDEARQFFVRQPIEADLAALLAEVDRLRSGIEALRKEYRHPDCFDALRRVAAADLAALLSPEDPR